VSGANLGIFMYDGLGRRAAKSIDGVTTQYLHDGLNPVQELSSAGTPTANLLTGLSIDEFFTRTDSAGSRSLLTDILGSAIALTDANGAMTTTYSYEPFGRASVGGAASTNPFQFTGRENDGTGLYYYRARYYHPLLQRFAAQDPIGFGGGDPNLYGYVFEGPTNFRDPFGLCVGILCLPTPTPTPTPSLAQVLQDAGNPMNLFSPNIPTGEPAKSCAPPPPPPTPACPGGNLGVISDLDLVQAATVGGVAAGVYIGGLWGGVAGGLIGFGIGNVNLIGRAGCP